MPISHGAAEMLPRPGAIYRCHVCRLELTIDEHTNKLTVAPFDVFVPPTDTATAADKPARKSAKKK
jgi:hypothetical protein